MVGCKPLIIPYLEYDLDLEDAEPDLDLDEERLRLGDLLFFRPRRGEGDREPLDSDPREDLESTLGERDLRDCFFFLDLFFAAGEGLRSSGLGDLDLDRSFPLSFGACAWLSISFFPSGISPPLSCSLRLFFRSGDLDRDPERE